MAGDVTFPCSATQCLQSERNEGPPNPQAMARYRQVMYVCVEGDPPAWVSSVVETTFLPTPLT